MKQIIVTTIYTILRILQVGVTGHSQRIVEASSDYPPLPEPANFTQTRREARSAKGAWCTTLDDVASKMLNNTRNGLIATRFRWRNFNVFIDNSYSNAERQMISNAMHTIGRALPCVRFEVFPQNSNPSGDYVHVFKGNGCWSMIGRRGGSQRMSLPSGCMRHGTIMHEMIHALGFFHEQSRTDRDNYVNIHWNNIIPGHQHNFNRETGITSFGVPYNPRSIMHYRSRDFSRNGQPTITAKNGGRIGDVGVLQSTDIQLMRRMYNC